MEDTKVERFKFTLPIIKTSVKLIKDEKGNEVEERYVEGIASGTELDKHGDRMAPSAIESMAKSLKQHIVALNAEHDTSWLGELGDIDKLEVSENNDLELKAKLNEMSSAKDLWYALTKQNKKLGLSIGGYVKEYEMVKEGEEGDTKWVRLYKEIDLDHIAVTSSPAYPKSWVSNIAKSINKNKKELLKKIEENKKEKSRESQKNKKLRELAKGIARSIQELESDLLLEFVYKGLFFLNDNQILLLERSLDMAKKDVSLEAEEAKKDDAEVVDPEDEKDEKSATPENEESEEEESEEKEEETSEEEETETKSDDDESEDKSGEEGEDKEKEENGEETSEDEEETESEKDEEETSEEESEEKSTQTVEVKADEKLAKTIGDLSKSLEKVLESNEKLSKRVEELEAQPADRKTVEVKKELGGEDVTQEDVKKLKNERDEEIEEARKTYKNDPTLFAKIQRIRAKYSKKLIKVIA